MNATVEFDYSQLIAFQEQLHHVIENDSIEIVADAHRRVILELTNIGVSADGEFFHAYNPEYAKKRARKGLRTDVKDLLFNYDMLGSLELRGDTLTVADDQQQKALGQMTGVNGKWGYIHNFLAPGEVADTEAEDALEYHLKEVFGD